MPPFATFDPFDHDALDRWWLSQSHCELAVRLDEIEAMLRFDIAAA